MLALRQFRRLSHADRPSSLVGILENLLSTVLARVVVRLPA